jgi:FkbM family methyltransferase
VHQPPPVVDALAGRVLAGALAPPLTDNVDPERFPDGMPSRTPAESVTRLDHLNAHADDLQWLADRLDPESQRRLLDRLVFHVLGHEHARVGPTRAEVDALLRTARTELIIQTDVTELRYAGSTHSQLFDLRPLGFAITLESYLLGVQGAFQLQQYRCPQLAQPRPAPGDVAIDAGACFGETALWLAHVVGETGRVISLEFSPGNLGLLRANLARNPTHAARIELVEAALWERSGEHLEIDMDGPASTITGGQPTGHDTTGATTIALDDLVTSHHLDHVDFVKLDIEGAETAALRGATRTLEHHRPRLALAAYHEIDHLWQLPRFLDALGLGYRFALGHFTMHDEETVLYATADLAQAVSPSRGPSPPRSPA